MESYTLFFLQVWPFTSLRTPHPNIALTSAKEKAYQHPPCHSPPPPAEKGSDASAKEHLKKALQAEAQQAALKEVRQPVTLCTIMGVRASVTPVVPD